MNDVHKSIISHIKETVKNDEEMSEFSSLVSLSDEQIVRRMFSNYREKRGFRLTQFGLQIMKQFFKGYEIKVPPDEKLQPIHLLFLDKRAKMPYYCSYSNDDKEKIVVLYDPVLAVKLRLVDGRLSILMDIEMEDF